MTNPTLMTELEAVNIMLGAIGESPVSSLDDPSLVDVALAKSILDETNVALQTAGTHFNLEKNYPLTADTDGNINVPANCTKIDAVGESVDKDLVLRGTKLYDRDERTFTFAIPTTIYVDMVLLLPFEEIPQYARRYICVKAARRFQARVVGSDTLFGFTQRDEEEALITYEQAEADTEDNNILNDSYSVSRITYRGVGRRTGG